MADETKPPAEGADPLAPPLFGPSRVATSEEMAVVDAADPGDGDDLPDGDDGDGKEEALDAGAPAPDAPAPGAVPAPVAAGQGEGGGGAEVISLRPSPEPPDFPKMVLEHFASRNAKTTGESYAGHLRRFLTWAAARNIDTATMPADTAMKYLTEAYPNPVSRNQGIVALRASFEALQVQKVPFSAQELVKTIRPPPKPKKEPAAAAVTPRGPALTVGQVSEPIPPREAIAMSVATEHAATPRGSPVAAPKKGTSAVPSLGGRIRISKRVDGSEGLPGVAVGALVVIGDYAGHDLDGEGRIENFIINHIRPVYGPRYGQRPTVYYVDRLDNLGNPIPGATLNVPIMQEPSPTSQVPIPPPAGAVATGPQQPAQAAAAPQGITGDRFFDYILAEQKRREEEADKRIAEIRAQATRQGMDPTMLMLLLDRAKPEPLDPQKLIMEAKRQGLIGRPPRDETPPPPPPPFPGGPGGPLGGMGDPFAMPEPRPDPGIEALTVVLKQQGEMISTLLTRAMTPQAPPPQMDLAGIITLAKSLAPAPPPESALGGKVMEALITRALAPPEKPKSIGETLKEIAALREASQLIGGEPEDKPVTFGEVIAGAIENAPAIGQAIATVMQSMPRAPTLPPPGTPARRSTDVQQPAAPPPARTPAAPIPQAAAEAFLALKTAEGEQEIVNHIFNILTAYVQSGAEPWPRAANTLVDAFKKCDTKIEIRAVATNLFVWSGAKRHMTDQIVDRITDVLHKHYSMIYSQLAPGQEKALKDTEGASPEAEAAAQAADEAAAQGEAPVYTDVQPDAQVGGAVVS